MKIMNGIFYIVIFIIGAILGSLFAQIIHRISKDKNIFTVHSYCEKCGEKLKLFEKIPIISYLFLRGKCKHCSTKIDRKYITLEMITGILFVLAAYVLNLNTNQISATNVISFIFVILYISYTILAIGINKANKAFSTPILTYGILISLLYIIYSCFTEKLSIYVNVIYLLLMTLLLLLNIVKTKKRAEGSYIIDLLISILIMLLFTGKIVSILTVFGTLITIAIYILLRKIRNGKANKKKTEFNKEINIFFIMGILNIVIFLILINTVR